MRIKNLLAGTFALSILVGVAAHEAEAGSRYCYPDLDRDGYGVLQGLFRVDADTCPDRSATKSGDCDDDEINVHPRHPEVGFNDIDDNCKNGKDEPTFAYYATGNQNTASSFRMAVNLNDLDSLTAAAHENLYVDIEYARLSNSANPVVLRKVRVLHSSLLINLTLTGLTPATVYRARVTFFKTLGASSFQQLRKTSDWYYTITDGTIPKTHTRALMVLKGFKELAESDIGQVGYRGAEENGTRYGAPSDEPWCSEFYAWVTETWLIGAEGQHYTGGLIDLFDEAGSFYRETEIPARAAPGDYLPIDTNRDGASDHSAMFLAYDTSQATPHVWTLEGNHYNTVMVESRAYTLTADHSVFAGLGYILNSMLR